jgi:hypothetical protein
MTAEHYGRLLSYERENYRLVGGHRPPLQVSVIDVQTIRAYLRN